MKMTAEQKAFKDGYTKARQEDEYLYKVVLARLNALEEEANENLDKIPEVFNGLEDSENWNYFTGVLNTVENIKTLLGV